LALELEEMLHGIHQTELMDNRTKRSGGSELGYQGRMIFFTDIFLDLVGEFGEHLWPLVLFTLLKVVSPYRQFLLPIKVDKLAT